MSHETHATQLEWFDLRVFFLLFSYIHFFAWELFFPSQGVLSLGFRVFLSSLSHEAFSCLSEVSLQKFSPRFVFSQKSPFFFSLSFHLKQKVRRLKHMRPITAFWSSPLFYYNNAKIESAFDQSTLFSNGMILCIGHMCLS